MIFLSADSAYFSSAGRTAEEYSSAVRPAEEKYAESAERKIIGAFLCRFKRECPYKLAILVFLCCSFYTWLYLDCNG